MELQGYYPEETLIEWIQNEEITKAQFHFHHSLERRRDFVEFCEREHLELSEDAADQFEAYLLNLEDQEDV